MSERKGNHSSEKKQIVFPFNRIFWHSLCSKVEKDLYRCKFLWRLILSLIETMKCSNVFLVGMRYHRQQKCLKKFVFIFICLFFLQQFLFLVINIKGIKEKVRNSQCGYLSWLYGKHLFPVTKSLLGRQLRYTSLENWSLDRSDVLQLC